jgi:hypothetical protein
MKLVLKLKLKLKLNMPRRRRSWEHGLFTGRKLTKLRQLVNV